MSRWPQARLVKFRDSFVKVIVLEVKIHFLHGEEKFNLPYKLPGIISQLHSLT